MITSVLINLLSLSSAISVENFTTVPPSSDCRIYNSALLQSGCGACSAFALAAVVGMYACSRENKDYIPSPFRLFDCTGASCEHGTTIQDVSLVMLRGGVEDVDESPSVFGLQCNLTEDSPLSGLRPLVVDIRGEAEIKATMIFSGLPLVGLIGGGLVLEPKSGMYQSTKTDPGHAVALIGWGTDHWIIQNSWGDSWGDGRGRARIRKDALKSAMDVTGFVRGLRENELMANTVVLFLSLSAMFVLLFGRCCVRCGC